MLTRIRSIPTGCVPYNINLAQKGIGSNDPYILFYVFTSHDETTARIRNLTGRENGIDVNETLKTKYLTKIHLTFCFSASM